MGRRVQRQTNGKIFWTRGMAVSAVGTTLRIPPNSADRLETGWEYGYRFRSGSLRWILGKLFFAGAIYRWLRIAA